MTSLNITSLRDPKIRGVAIPPETDTEWDAWGVSRIPAPCQTSSTKEVAPDGQVLDTDWSADCSLTKEDKKRFLPFMKAKQVGKLQTLQQITLAELKLTKKVENSLSDQPKTFINPA
eukprot:CAMPEP_0113711906 /NCGR_PEP_ID=MMETSP0038_2-20120614/31056_1 /TAXON_ID=2898 /ORGANISM="Cryptomonas paramecium" /LENGTH=116 /DNA_ID=CAMNT_0000638293 /DNA_START=108 /DNA_END=458 /DNA_ORIENTATION=- /assembly_acc=CAM_ASM_000170